MKKRRKKKNEWKMGRKGGMKNALHNNLISFLLCLYPQDNVCESVVVCVSYTKETQKNGFVLFDSFLCSSIFALLLLGKYYYNFI